MCKRLFFRVISLLATSVYSYPCTLHAQGEVESVPTDMQERAEAHTAGTTPAGYHNLTRRCDALRSEKLWKFIDPKLSATGDFQTLFTDDHCSENRGRPRIKSGEINFSAHLFAHMRGDFTGAFEQEYENDHLNTTVDVEEAFLTLHSMPFGSELQFGRKLMEFGRLNANHPHHWPFADTPLALETFFGHHPWIDDGAQASVLIPNPWDLYAKVTFGFWRGKKLGHGHHHGEGAEHEAHGHETHEHGEHETHGHEDHHLHEKAHEHDDEMSHGDECGHAGETHASCGSHAAPVDWDKWVKTGRFSLDIPFGRNSHLLLGHSVAWDANGDSRLFGADCTYKHRWPNTYRKFTWQNEFIYGDIRERSEERAGAYSLASLTLDKHWEVGTRGDWVERMESSLHDELAGSFFLSYYLTHSIRVTTQYRLRRMSCGEKENALYLQLVCGFGPHAHRLED